MRRNATAKSAPRAGGGSAIWGDAPNGGPRQTAAFARKAPNVARQRLAPVAPTSLTLSRSLRLAQGHHAPAGASTSRRCACSTSCLWGLRLPRTCSTQSLPRPLRWRKTWRASFSLWLVPPAWCQGALVRCVQCDSGLTTSVHHIPGAWLARALAPRFDAEAPTRTRSGSPAARFFEVAAVVS